ncbi:MAG TPA: NAD-dependent epimerase/dehydratase family protein [Vicinamibacterales bacterium]|nr:NAD-dependent epimerase/dehydratase family protein [Vicinamibacterales bacterium]
MRTALVTGASGMLGAHIVERLASVGWNVRAFVRNASKSGWLAPLGASLVEGDLTDKASVRRAAVSCDAIFHAGAAVGSGGTWETFHAANVLGTANVVEAASDGARLVQVSSTAVFGGERYQSHPTDETLPLPQLPDHDTYGRSKQDAERLVLDAADKGRVWATVVRPPVMYGRGDRQFVPRIGPVFLRGVFPLIDGGAARLPIVNAAAVADGAVLAAGADVARGRVYLLTNDTPVTVADLVGFAAEGLGLRVRTPRLSLTSGGMAFGLLRAALRMAGRSDLAAHATGTLRMLTRDNPFTSARAFRELGWAPRTDPSRELPEAFRQWKRSRREKGGW